MKIPFDIKFRPQIESGEYKVQTKNGEHVEILKWEMRSINNLYPILAVVSDKKIDEALRYSDKGYCGRADYSLFLVTPESEMTTFEKRFLEIVVEIVEEKDNECPHPLEYAAELLELAKKELVKEGTSKNEMGTMLYDAGFEDGKEEALKNLPSWITNLYKETPELHISWRKGVPFICVNDKMISVEDLKKLFGFND